MTIRVACIFISVTHAGRAQARLIRRLVRGDLDQPEFTDHLDDAQVGEIRDTGVGDLFHGVAIVLERVRHRAADNAQQFEPE